METKNLAKKIFQIQQELQPITKDQPNPYFKSHYFNIDSVIAGLRPILNKYGVAVIQPLHDNNGRMMLGTLLIDSESGESLSWSFLLPEVADPQKMGAAITYFRRFALTSLFLIEGEKDMDGNDIVETVKKEFTKPTAEQVAQVFSPAPAQAAMPPAQKHKYDKVCISCGVQFSTSYAKATTCWNCKTKAEQPPQPLAGDEIPF